MADNSKIQWTDATLNFWHGCTKVSDGCKFCYMYRDKTKYGQDPTKVVRSKTTFYNSLKWKEPRMIFTCSWSDFFIEDADEWRDEAWDVIRRTPQHTYQILTKRPENIVGRLPKDWGNGYPNVWLGTSIESYKHVDRLVELHNHKDNNSTFKTFVSAEPLLSSIEFANDGMVLSHEFSRLDWLIIGGESGNENGYYRYRPCELDWIYDLVQQAREMKVPIFIKQLGTHLAKEMGLKDRHGGDIEEFPKDLQIQEMP